MLRSLLYPESVAVIGASRTLGKIGHELLANLIAGGFEGKIVPINPCADEVLGLKCYPDLKTANQAIDLGIIAIPAKLVRSAIDDSIAAGAKAVAVITAGFKEVGSEGRKFERELAEVCSANKVRLLGPNCLGLINTHHRMKAAVVKHMPDAGSISVISQSGALCTILLDWAVAHGIGLAKVISMGNKADLNETDLLEVLAQDKQTGTIVCYLESVDVGDEFIKAAEAAASVKPVVVLKAGTSEAGVRAAAAHTGGMAGVDMAYGAAFRRSGVVRAESLEALFDCAMALATQPLPRGDRVAIITNAGGLGIVAADAVEHSGMEVAALGDRTTTALRGTFPTATGVGNPLDLLDDADPVRYATAVRAALDDDSVDAVIVALAPQATTLPTETACAVAGCMRSDKPMVASFVGGEDVRRAHAKLVASNLPNYPAPERAVAALRAMCDYAEWRRRPPRIVTRFPAHSHRVDRILARLARTKRTQIGEVDAKHILHAYGFNVPSGYVATSADEAVDVAKRIGYPVAMKIVSPDIIHKFELGGVKLALANAEQVRDAFDLMLLRIGQRRPEASLVGAYVERMCDPGQEVVLGMSRDPQFGPILMFGLGGIFVEPMRDAAFHLAPITAEEAVQMLRGTRSYALLRRQNGRTDLDLPAIARCLQQMSQLATDFPTITDVSIHPLIVEDRGTDPVVANATMTLVQTGVDNGERVEN